MLTPSVVFTNAILALTGRFGKPVNVPVKGVAHVTGGGIPSKLKRVLKKSGFGADLTDLWQPHPAMLELIKIGNVQTEEAYRTWNLSNGMMVILDQQSVKPALEILKEQGIQAKVAGKVIEDPNIRILAFDDSEVIVTVNN